MGWRRRAGGLFLLFNVACGPKCLVGHNETRHQEGYTAIELLMMMPAGKTMIPIYHSVYHAPSDYQVFVCDSYELERMPK